nr:MAG TPA: hypothetical protein [Caudoviricetes sp.]
MRRQNIAITSYQNIDNHIPKKKLITSRIQLLRN